MNQIKKIKSIILGVLLVVSILAVINPVSAYSIQGAIDAAPVGGVVIVPAGTYHETINITKAITLQGADKATTIIKPAASGTEWISIQASDVHIKNLTFDGTGYSITRAITTRGSGSITNCIIKNIADPDVWEYDGKGIYIHWDTSGQNWELSGNEFRNIKRIGIAIYAAGNKATISNNIFLGNGAGDWVEYAIQVEEGSIAYIDGNNISNYGGVVSPWDSAGILVSSYFAPKSTAYITNNTIFNNTIGIAVGYVDDVTLTDTSIVSLKCNNIFNNKYRIVDVSGTTVKELPCSSQLPMGRILGILRSNYSKNNGNGGNASGTD